jgi:hypothetical protein
VEQGIEGENLLYRIFPQVKQRVPGIVEPLKMPVDKESAVAVLFDGISGS